MFGEDFYVNVRSDLITIQWSPLTHGFAFQFQLPTVNQVLKILEVPEIDTA